MSGNGTDGHYDAVIVGSGFGGSVTAYRLAEAGKRVRVLERGRAYPPGSFTRSPYRARESFWDPRRGLTGMYHYWSFRGIDALVSAGLGGGSLIYANVFIRKDERWFVQEDLRDGGYEHWPVTRADLDPHYDRVEAMIGLQRYPFDHEPYSKTPKTIAFKAAAEANGLEWFLPKLAVTFANEGQPPRPGQKIEEQLRNLHDRDRTTCQLCGECDVGCNFGAKNTLDYNYLTHAAHHGAEISTLCDVRSFEPRDGGGYVVHYAQLSEGVPADDGQPAVLKTVTCDHLVLSAGTLGTTSLLLRNRAAFPRMSRRLGTRFCGNGDLLTLAINCREMVDGKPTPRIVDPGYGPVITSTARMPDALAGGAEPARDGAGALMFHLTIEVQDMAQFSHDPLRAAVATGYLRCDALGGHLPVEQGWFNLFVDTEPGVKRMLYRLWFRDGVGHPLTLSGYKLVRDDAGFDVWRDTTTLFPRVVRGHVEADG